MSNELVIEATPGLTVYCTLWNTSAQVWNGSTFSTYADGNWSTYAVTMTELGASGRYYADLPAGTEDTAHYYYTAYEQQGGSPAVGDADYKVGIGEYLLPLTAADVWTYVDRTLTSESGGGGGGGGGGSGGGFGALPPAVYADGDVAPTRLDQIMISLRARLSSALELPYERVLLSDPESIDQHAHGDQYLVVWPDLENTTLFPGAGRLDTRETVRVFVSLRTRKALDESNSLALWLTDRVDAAAGDNVGHLIGRHAVYDALVGYQLTTDGTEQGNWLVDRPIVPRSASRPRRERRDKEWGESTMAFDVTYILNLTQSYQ